MGLLQTRRQKKKEKGFTTNKFDNDFLIYDYKKIIGFDLDFSTTADKWEKSSYKKE